MRSSKEQKPKEAKKIHEAKRRVVEKTVNLLEPVSFSGIVKRKLEENGMKGERKRTCRRKGFEKSAPEASARSVMAGIVL